MLCCYSFADYTSVSAAAFVDCELCVFHAGVQLTYAASEYKTHIRSRTMGRFFHVQYIFMRVLIQHMPYTWVAAGLVETSNNLAAVKPSSSSDSEAKYTITMSSRSSLTHAMEVQRARIAAIAGLCGATVAQDKAYPGWAPNPASPVLQVGYLQSL